MSTKDYLDSKWPDLHSQPTIEKPITEVNEIDEDIEKQIRQLQEQKFNKGIQNVLPKEVDLLGHRLDSFLSTVKVEKQQLEEKVKKEEIKIGALEDLFSTLKQEKKQPVEEKKVEPKVEIKKEPKKVEANAIKTQEIEAASSVLEYLLPKEVEEYDDNIIDKVSKQISEMKVANELEKDKISKLRSIDTLEKLTEEFLRFKNVTSVQLSTLGGGGSVRILDNDDVDISSIADGKILEYNSTTKKMEFVSSGDSVNNLEVLGSITFEGSTADDFETTFNVTDPTADRTITLPNASGTIPVLAVTSNTQITATPEELNHVDGVTGNIQTALDSKATEAFAIAQAVALG
jgi:ketosteroid isomerase-like protein